MAAYALNEDKMFSDIADGIAIVINSETGIYYGMNGFGTMVYEQILKGGPVEDITAALKTMPDAPEDMEKRMADFVKTLVDFGILLPAEAKETELELDQVVAQADEFELQAQEFSDAQELLLADPIHEVKTDTGWEPDKDALETDEEALAQKEAKKDQ